MREPLYRGKRDGDGKWVTGRTIIEYGDGVQLSNGLAKAASDSGYSKYWLIPKTDYVIPETVGEYTGFLDKNSVRIFDGDIVKDNFGNIGVIVYTEHFLEWRIRFYKGREDLIGELGVDLFSWVYPEMRLEVIGNVFDNPELLQAN